MKLHRFQVNKFVALALKQKHPWIYRKHCSTALNHLKIGSFVRVVGPKNEFLGIGLYEPLSLVAIRIFCFEDIQIDEKYFYEKLLLLLQARKTVAKQYPTEGFRWVHGEADEFPGINIDVYKNTAVVVFYLTTWESHLGPVLADIAKNENLDFVFKRLPHGQEKNNLSQQETLYDFKSTCDVNVDEPTWFLENEMAYPVFLKTGQKTGFYLDLREIRTSLIKENFKNKRVLNLFASSGILSGLAEKKGAKCVVSVEASSWCQEQFEQLKKVWNLKNSCQKWVHDDVWSYLKSDEFSSEEVFDVIVLDPPGLAKSKTTQKNLKNTWSNLVKSVLKKISRKGVLFTICCTERISLQDHKNWTKNIIEQNGLNLKAVQKIKTTFDHPVSSHLVERDYFHAYVWRCE